MPKLPKGMFRRRDRRSYYARIFEGGQERWVSLGVEYSEALHKLRALRRGEEPLEGGATTVAKAAQDWLATRIANGRNPKGQQLAATRVKKYLRPYLGHVLVEKITPDLLRRYRVWLEGECRSAGTVAHVLRDARCFLYWCEETGLLERAPVPKRWLPRVPESEPDRLFDVEVERLVSLPDPHGFVLRLALGTGLRWSELCRLQASHLQNGMLVVGQTKSGKVRRVPVGAELAREIRSHVGRLVPFAAASPGSFTRVVRQRSGIARFHVHQCRHTFACRWLERGGSLAALQELLGHASIVTTQRYARLSEDLVRREAERLGAG